MVNTIERSQTKAWAKAIAQPAKEFPPTPLQVLSGKIPEGLRGSLYRNGPGRLERNHQRVGHWFDGDGAILAVHFTDDGVTSLYRYVQSKGYQHESKEDKFLYGNYGMTAPGPVWNQWLRPLKNAANTSVLALPDKLLALWEGDNPYALDLQTLETKGLDNLGGLDKNFPYSAHPKCDAQTGEIFNFGQGLGSTPKVSIFKSDRTGKVIKKSDFKLDGLAVLHDFVLAGKYLVFFIPPARINPLPILAGLKPYSESVEWQPKLGTQVLVVDRETLNIVSRFETEPWYQWHFANGYVDDSGSIIVHVVRYPDFPSTNQYLKEVATGNTHTFSKATLWQVTINPQSGKVTKLEEVLDRSCEFPLVQQSQVGKSWRYLYLAIHRQEEDVSKEILNAIARYDRQTDTLTEANLGENRYPSEPIYAADVLDPEQGWIIIVVYDGNSDTSEVWIYDCDRLDESPVCRLGLPSVIPHSFHGTWKPA